MPLFLQISGESQTADLDVLFDRDDVHAAAAVRDVSLPPLTITKQKPPPRSLVYMAEFCVLGSCRGFIALFQHPHYFIIWNPLTGSHKQISFSHIVRRNDSLGGDGFTGNALLFGFGYDPSQDDYLVVLAWRDKYGKNERHLDFFSLRSNSCKSFDVLLPSSLGIRGEQAPGLYLNEAIHWLIYRADDNDGSVDTCILVFDMRKRSFSWSMPVPPEQLEKTASCELLVLGGCLAFYCINRDRTNKVWIMKEYQVHTSSWVLYKIPGYFFRPEYLSKNGDIIGFDRQRGRWLKYNFKGRLLRHSEHFRHRTGYLKHTMYTESLLRLPNDYEEEMKKRERLDHQNEVRKGKRIRSAPTWARDFCCN